MSSHLQIEANRRNSKKSTGPRTAAGKAISAANRPITTGIYAEAEIIRDESAADLEALVAGFHTHHHPDGPVERALVDTLVHNEWLLRRLRRAEAQLWEKNIEATESSFGENLHELGRAVSSFEGRIYARLQHRLTAVQRNFQRALKDLELLQSQRPSQPEPVAKIEPASALTSTAQIGFVSSPVESVRAAAPVPVPQAAILRAPVPHVGSPSTAEIFPCL